MKPRLIVEFGTRHGGGAMFFETLLHSIHRGSDKYRVLSVDRVSSNNSANHRASDSVFHEVKKHETQGVKRSACSTPHTPWTAAK